MDYEQQNYHNGGKFISDKELRKVFTQLKKVDKYRWLNSYSNDITKQAIKDAVGAYKNFFSGVAKFPRFKTKRRSSPSFYVDTAKIKFSASHVKLEKIADNNQRNRGQLNFIRLAEHGRIPLGVKYLNPVRRIELVDNCWYRIQTIYQNAQERRFGHRHRSQ